MTFMAVEREAVGREILALVDAHDGEIKMDQLTVAYYKARARLPYKARLPDYKALGFGSLATLVASVPGIAHEDRGGGNDIIRRCTNAVTTEREAPEPPGELPDAAKREAELKARELALIARKEALASREAVAKREAARTTFGRSRPWSRRRPKAPAGQKPSENPGPNGPRTQGKIKTKVDKESKGYNKGHPAYGSADDRRFTCGVITPTDGGAEIFYMARGEAGLTLRAGQRVTYVEDENRQGPIAHYVRDAGKGAAAPAATAAAPESDRPEPTDPGAFPALASKASPWGGAPKPKPPPAQTKPKLRGTVTAVKPKQRHGGPGPSYGFVRPDAGGDDVFVAFVDVVDQAKLGEGDRVDYELIPNTGARKSNASGSNANPKYAVKCGRVVILPKGAPHKGAPQEQDPGREESKAEPAPEGYEVVARVLAHLGESRLLPTFLAQQIDDAALPYLEPSDMLELGVAPMICLAILGASAAGGKGKKLETEDVMHDVATHQSVLEEELRGHRAELERLRISRDELSEDLCCSITYELMKDPYICVGDSHTYERVAIEQWFATGARTSPTTNESIDNLTLIPNHAVKRLIVALLERHRETCGGDERRRSHLEFVPVV